MAETEAPTTTPTTFPAKVDKASRPQKTINKKDTKKKDTKKKDTNEKNTNKKDTDKKDTDKKDTDKKDTDKKDTDKKDTKQKRTRTTGMALLQSLTAKKAAQEAMIKSAKAKVHVSFDDDGEVVTTPVEETTTDDSKKRKQSPTEDDQTKAPTTPKKEKKRKGTHHLQGPSNKKKEESLAYLQVFLDNRSQWKFGKKQQSWLLQHIYDTEAISTEVFDRLLLYVKDLVGMAREKTLQEAQTICQETKGTTTSSVAAPQVDPTPFDADDDFDAEKLLASSTFVSAPPAQQPVDETTNEAPAAPATADDGVKLDRAKAVVRILM